MQSASVVMPGGLIPAGAGRTPRSHARVPLGWAHPRWRGADLGELPNDIRRDGSSPLARGGPVSHGLPHGQDGLIPAGAGRTRHTTRRRGRSWAHPRWRGADKMARPATRQTPGSSPLARGGHRRPHRDRPLVGLIPAGAGRTMTTTSTSSPRRAHPRWRGADDRGELDAMSFAGSSPLARGGPSSISARRRFCGLIPAGAGRTGRPGTAGRP